MVLIFVIIITITIIIIITFILIIALNTGTPFLFMRSQVSLAMCPRCLHFAEKSRIWRAPQMIIPKSYDQEIKRIENENKKEHCSMKR